MTIYLDDSGNLHRQGRLRFLPITLYLLVLPCCGGGASSFNADAAARADANQVEAGPLECPSSAPPGPWGARLAADLPKGPCDTGTPECETQTIDTCPSGTRGPTVNWSCTCSNGNWQCHETARGKTACF